MKRNFKLIVAVLVLAVMAFTFASCDKIMPHKHEYSSDWSSDATNHWHAALCDDAEPADVAAHEFVDGACSVCGYKPDETACTHEAMTSEVVKEATCTEAGEKKFTCTDCGHSYTQELAVVDHTIEKLEAVEPTCTENGLGKGEKCSVCGVILKAQSVIESTGHDFVDGVCSNCDAVDPDYNGAKKYVFDAGVLALKDKVNEDGAGESIVSGTDNFFTIHYALKTKVTANAKTFEDGYASVNRVDWQTGTTFYEKENGELTAYSAIEFEAHGTTTIKIWWGSAGDGRQVAIFNADGKIVTQTDVVSVKNSLYISELTIHRAGKYYIGNPDGNNYYFHVEAIASPEETPLAGTGSYDDPYVIPHIADYTTNAAGLVFYQYTVPADGYVTLSSDWAGGSVWLKLGTDINTADDNEGNGSLKYFALKDTVLYIAVSDWNEVAEAVPFKVSFEKATLGSIENMVGSWKGDIAGRFGSATVIYSISEDGTGFASMDHGWGPNKYTIDKVIVVDNDVIIYLTNSFGNPETHKYVYAETEDGSKTLTGGVNGLTGQLTPYDGEVGGDELNPEVSYDTVIVIGANTLYFSADEVAANTATRTLNITLAGNYKLASGNLFVSSVVDANGNAVAKNDDYSYTLAEGEYTLTFGMFSMFGVSADAACDLNVEDAVSGGNEGGEGGEGDEEEYPEFQYDAEKEAICGTYEFDAYTVMIFEKWEIGTYLANVYVEGEYDLYFTFNVTVNDNGSSTLTLSYYYMENEINPDMVETVLGYNIVVVPQTVE